jgi:ADP-ribose diphosphatase
MPQNKLSFFTNYCEVFYLWKRFQQMIIRSWKMNNFERHSSENIENEGQESKLAPSYQDIYPDTPHRTARMQVNAKMLKIAQVELGWTHINRQYVPDEMVDWKVDMQHYNPPVLDLPRGITRFRKDGDAPQDSDPSMINTFKSLETADVIRDNHGFPLNPIGRTGLRGRGILDKWGPTEAADPVVTRHNPQSGELEVLIIQRGDTGEWAFPGGKVDEGEIAAAAAGRELAEEAGIGGIVLDFSEADVVYAGYIDDSRNTDNAWMESTALHLHLNAEQASVVAIMAGSDADAVRWAAVNETLYSTMLKAHADILSLATGEKPQTT